MKNAIAIFPLILLLMSGMAYAQTLEEVEGHFQKGIQYSQSGMKDESIAEFRQVVEADPTNLPKDYYEQTYSEAFFDIGVLYAQKGDNEKGAEYLKKALEVFPNHKMALYYLSNVLMNIGEFAEAKPYYDRAKELGFTGGKPGDDVIGDYFNIIKERELTIQYPLFFEPGKSISVTIKGTFNGDEDLLRDTITALEKYAKLTDYSGSFNQISADLIRLRENKTVFIEKWVVGESGNQKEFWVRYNFAPPKDFPYKVMIQTSEKEPVS
ncbi:MAG: tetratricopeptide repeat protein [Candidatus Omnitrophica bacterium]|nr:tetratricopeptide repeat protein [Candidatus Omnitrophota bacterium]